MSHTSNAEEQEILLTDLGKLRLQTKALRSKVRRLEETNTRIVGENERLLLLQQHHIQQHQQLSRPASARSTFSDRVKANRQRGDSAGKGEFSKLNNYQSRAGDETHHNNTSLSKSKGEGKEEVEEEDFGSTPSLKAQWDKQKMLNEMNEKISNGSLKEVLVNNIPTIDSSDDDNDYDSDYDNSDMEEEEEEEDDNDTDDVGGKLVDIDGNEGEEEDNEGNGGGDYAFFGMSSREYKRTAGYGSGPEIDHQAAQHHQHQYRHHHGGDDDDSMHGDVVKEFW